MNDSMIIEGKEYISSRRAAEIGKYSNDYIGQLCRGQKISARMIGRSWFVERHSFEEYMKDIEIQKHELGLRSHLSARSNDTRPNDIGVREAIEAKSSSVERPVASPFSPYPSTAWAVTYSEDSRPLLPVLKKESPQRFGASGSKMSNQPSGISVRRGAKGGNRSLHIGPGLGPYRGALMVTTLAVLVGVVSFSALSGFVYFKPDSARRIVTSFVGGLPASSFENNMAASVGEISPNSGVSEQTSQATCQSAFSLEGVARATSQWFNKIRGGTPRTSEPQSQSRVSVSQLAAALDTTSNDTSSVPERLNTSLEPISSPSVEVLEPAKISTSSASKSQTFVSSPFKRDLTIGSKGDDVKTLQVLLNKSGFIIASTGPGSPGRETTTFGPSTARAIEKLQCERGIVCGGSSSTTGYGMVDTDTRSILNSLHNLGRVSPKTKLPKK